MNKTHNDENRPKLQLLASEAKTKSSQFGENASDSFDALQKLEKRIVKLEEEYQKAFSRFETEFESIVAKTSPSEAIPKIQEELARILDLISKGRLGSMPQPKAKSDANRSFFAPRASLKRKGLFYLKQLLSLKTYQRWLMGIPSLLEKEDFDEFGRDPKFEDKVKPFFNFLYHHYWRVSVSGLENIPNAGAGLIVANHSGTLPFDGSMIRIAVQNEHPSKREVRFLVEDFVYYLPFLGTFMYRTGGVRASQDNAERLLRRNHLVAVFPEGEKGIGKNYRQRYHLQRFGRGGFIRLALRTGAPIIPCAILGAEETHPLLYRANFLAKPLGVPYVPITPTIPWLGPLGLIGLPAKWHIFFGKPIQFSKYGEEAIHDDLLVHRLSEQVRQIIQEMIVQGLKKRRSIWF